MGKCTYLASNKIHPHRNAGKWGQYTDFHQVRFSIQGNNKHYIVIHRHWVL